MNKKNVYGFISILICMTCLLSGCIHIEGEGSGGEPSSVSTSSDSPDSPEEPDPGPKEEADLEYEYEYVRAALKDNVLTITILPGDAASQSLGPDNGLRYNEPYPVSGLTDSYTDLFVGSMGNSVSPFVFLLTERETVECVPVGSALLAWANGSQEADPVFTSTGELPGADNVTSFYEGTVSSGSDACVTVFAVTAYGYDIDLSLPCYFAMNPQDAPPTEEEADKILMDNVRAAGLEDLIEQGIYTLGTGETEYLYGDYCYITGVGSDQTDNVAHMQFFGVAATGAVYKQYEGWRPSNMLAEIYSGSGDYDLFAIISEPNGNELNEIYFTGRMEEVVVSDPLLYTDTPMLLLPLKNDLKIKAELIDFTPDGEITSETILAELTLSRGDLCAIYAKKMFDTSPLFICAEWQDGSEEYTVYWWAVGGSEYGEDYMSYVSAVYDDPAENAAG